MKTRIFLPFMLMATLATTVLFAQENTPVRMKMPAGGYEFARKLTSTTIPFKLINNLIIVQVELNGTKMNLVLDSGMPFDGAILFGSDKVDLLKLSYSSKMPVCGVDGSSVLADVSMGATLKVPKLTLTNQMIAVIPRDPVRSQQFEGQDGIIGSSFFAHFIVAVNYERQVIIISKPGNVNFAKAGLGVPVEVRENRIFLKADLQLENGSEIPGEFVVDTGNRSTLMLNTVNNSNLVLPDKTISYFTRGLTGKMECKMGRIKSLKFGDCQMNNVLASFNDGTAGTPPSFEKEGNLGNQILRRFNVTFDIPGNRIYFKKNELYNEPFEFNLAGFQIERTVDKNMVVNHVVPGSPADKAEIKPGDKIIMINSWPSSQLSMDEFEQTFGKTGSRVSVLIEHFGKTKNINLQLERFI
ncbi:MAG: aspartyl protease family protein [Candidatus Marinimicrobia bacterium]|nr:aspartyl protease family protein [Candidatus Neomarinimicrobiota bacterium]